MNKKVSKENFNGYPCRASSYRCLRSLLFVQERSRSGSLSSNYAGFRFNKIIVLPFCYQKVPQLRLFPSVACSSYFGYFVQFSRCGSDLKSDSNTCQNKCLNPNSASCKVFFAFFLFQKKEGGGDKRDRTVDPLLAKQVLSQLSYTPTSSHIKGGGPKWTRTTDLTIISRAL